MKAFWPKALKPIQRQINQWTSNYPELPIAGTIWEQLIVNAFKDLKIPYQWKATSHEKGTDIRFDFKKNNFAISAKTGQIKGGQLVDETYTFPSYRTTSHKNLEDKIKHIDSIGENFGGYCCCFKVEKNKASKLGYNFVFAYIPSHLIKASKMSWTTDSAGNFIGTGKNIQMKITKSMSDQLWITLDKDFFNHPDCFMIKF